MPRSPLRALVSVALTSALSVALACPVVPAQAGERDTIVVEKRTVTLLSIRRVDGHREVKVEVDGRRYAHLRRGEEFGRPKRFLVATIHRDCAYFTYSRGSFVAAFGLCVD